MANFSTHLMVSTVLGGVVAPLAVATQVIAPEHLPVIFLAVAIGGLLPDIDSDNSHSLNIVFSVLGFLVMVALLDAYSYVLGVLDFWAISVLLYAGIKWIILPIFKKLTIHRGALHSILACVMFSLITVNLLYHGLSYPSTVAWFAGLSIFIGSLSHLLLDEIYSVDLMNVELKKSFGSAIKPLSLRHWTGSLTIAVISLALFLIKPPVEQVIDKVDNVQVASLNYSYLYEKIRAETMTK